MIDRMLDMKAVEYQALILQPEVINLNELLAEVVANYKEKAQQKLIKIYLPTTETTYKALLDKNYTLQIIENLLSNALKFSPPKKNIFIELSNHQNKVKITIKDEGPGISTEDQQKLFGKFQRLSARPTGGETSVGLGLSIVKKFAEAMNGKIWCESTLGQGASFIVEFQKV